MEKFIFLHSLITLMDKEIIILYLFLVWFEVLFVCLI